MRMFRNDWTSLLMCRAAIGVFMLFGAGIAPATAATISRSVNVQAPASIVWSLIGPFCGIKGWLPPVGQCIEDGKTPPTRILVTRDGRAAFVETQTARSELGHSYSYRFLSQIIRQRSKSRQTGTNLRPLPGPAPTSPSTERKKRLTTLCLGSMTRASVKSRKGSPNSGEGVAVSQGPRCLRSVRNLVFIPTGCSTAVPNDRFPPKLAASAFDPFRTLDG